MNIDFENTALEELYTTGATQDHQYKRLKPNIIMNKKEFNEKLEQTKNDLNQKLQNKY